MAIDTGCERTIRFGDVRVSPICGAQVDLPVWDDMPAPREGWRALFERYPWAFDGPTMWRFHVHAFLVKTPDATILVDTGAGTRDRVDRWLRWAFPRSWTSAVVRRAQMFPASLGAAGESPSTIDHVVLTHLHMDHAGWAVSDDGSPLFPNARYHVSGIEWEWMRAGPNEELRRQFQSYLRPLVDGERLDLADDTFEVAPGVHTLPVPGHTPGHRAVLVQSGERHVLLAGDLVHHPFQLNRPDWSAFDEDESVARGGRHNLLARVASGSWVMAASHFGDPFGTLETEGQGFAWRSYPPDRLA